MVSSASPPVVVTPPPPPPHNPLNLLIFLFLTSIGTPFFHVVQKMVHFILQNTKLTVAFDIGGYNQ